jgi:hypothetical protein
MGGKIVRTIGIARARLKIDMMNLGYSIRRLVQIERAAAAPARVGAQVEVCPAWRGRGALPTGRTCFNSNRNRSIALAGSLRVLYPRKSSS